VRETVDVPLKSVYVAARNLVLGLNLLPRSPFRAAPSSELPKTWLVTVGAMNAWAFNRKREKGNS